MKYDVLGADEAFILGRWLFLSSRLYHHLMVHQPSTYILSKDLISKDSLDHLKRGKFHIIFPKHISHTSLNLNQVVRKNVWGTA